MRLERNVINHTLPQITATRLDPKNPRSAEEKLRKVLKPRSRGKSPGLAPLIKSFWKYQKRIATYRTAQCDLIIFYLMPFITIQSSNI